MFAAWNRSASSSRGGPFRNEPGQAAALQAPSPQLLTCSVRVSDSSQNNGRMRVTENDVPGNEPTILPLRGSEAPTMVKPLTERVNEPIGNRPLSLIFADTVNGGVVWAGGADTIAMSRLNCFHQSSSPPPSAMLGNASVASESAVKTRSSLRKLFMESP